MTELQKKSRQLELLNNAYESIISRKSWYTHPVTDEYGGYVKDENGITVYELDDNVDAIENIDIIEQTAKAFLAWAMKF